MKNTLKDVLAAKAKLDDTKKDLAAKGKVVTNVHINVKVFEGMLADLHEALGTESYVIKQTARLRTAVGKASAALIRLRDRLKTAEVPVDVKESIDRCCLLCKTALAGEDENPSAP